jgi:hypothetical protein
VQARGEHEPHRRWSLRKVYAGVAAAGVVFGALAAGLSLIDWVADRFDRPTPAVIDPRISSVRQRDARQPLDDYLRETRQPRTGFSPEQLRQAGYVFSVHLDIRGAVGNEFELRWAMYDAKRERRLRGPTYNQVAGDVRPESPRHSRTWPVWVPYPRTGGTYFVRFTLDDDRHQPVSELDSQRFTFSRNGT